MTVTSTFTVQSDNPSFVGAKGASVEMPKFDVGGAGRGYKIQGKKDPEDVIDDMDYKITLDDGQIIDGKTALGGQTKLAEKETMGIANIQLWKEKE